MHFLPLLSLAALASTAVASPMEARGAYKLPSIRNNDLRKTCVVPSHKNASISDVPAIHKAFEECGNYGKIVFSKGEVYAINELLVMEGCNQCVVEWDGELRQSADIPTILETQVFFTYQNKSTNILLKKAHGAYIHSPAGTGKLNGQGQVWWDANKNDSDLDPGTLRRPMLWTIIESDHVLVDGLTITESPNWNLMVWNSSYVTYQNMAIDALTKTSSKPKNTDGWDTYNCDHVLIQDSVIDTGDDCVAWKGNNTHMTARNLVCRGTHGVSVGSLAQYAGIHDYVKGVYVKNVTFEGGDNAIRIKVWPSLPEHGSASVEDVFYSNVTVNDVTSPIFIESCYQSTAEECVAYPSKSTLKNIHIDNVRGTSNGKKNATIGDLRCPPSGNCTIFLSDIDITPGGDSNGTTGVFLCEGLAADPGVPCISSTINDPGNVQIPY